jgi:hypothetical protein
MSLTASMAKKLKKEIKTAKLKFVCQFCEKAYVQESRFLAHSCTRKTRYNSKEEKWFKLAFKAYRRAFEHASGRKKTYTIDDFIRSYYYTAFVAYGKYLVSKNVIMPDYYTDYLIKGRTCIDDWAKDSVYEEFVRNLNKAETPMDALNRNLLLMEEWGLSNNEDWRDFFRKIPPSLAALWIRSGRISPWMLFLAPSSRDLLIRMSDEQLDIVKGVIEDRFWLRRTSKFEEESRIIQQILEKEGL